MVAFVSAFSGVSLARPSAFSGSRISSRNAPIAAKFTMVKSAAIPYAEAPPKLDGSMPGDIGFDPLGFSNKFDLNFMRESELKHGMYF